jgi:hypothetical protein
MRLPVPVILKVEEIEEGNTTTLKFKRWQPHPGSQDAISSGSGGAPAREGEDADRRVALTTVAHP